MSKFGRIVKGLVALLIIAFVVALVVGLYMAVDNFGKEGVSSAAPAVRLDEYQSVMPTGEKPTIPAELASSTDDEVDVGGSDNDPISRAGALQATSDPSTPPAASVSASSPNSGVVSDSPTAIAAPPANQNAGKTYHDAWDEFVSEGHYETRHVEAIYGQREVYGSVCNTCLANISGFALAHIKDARHSGYHDGVIGSESYIIKPATTEQVWVDTSYTIHHPAYWD